MLKEELLERYEQTGRIGFYKPHNSKEATKLIESLCEIEEVKTTEEETVEVISLSEMITRMKEMFE